MTYKDQRFLIDEFPNFFKGDIFNNNVRNAYYETERIIQGYDQIKKRGCNCQWNDFQHQINKLYEEWLQNQSEAQVSNQQTNT
jgi:hypothetical protein